MFIVWKQINLTIRERLYYYSNNINVNVFSIFIHYQFGLRKDEKIVCTFLWNGNLILYVEILRNKCLTKYFDQYSNNSTLIICHDLFYFKIPEFKLYK